MHDDFATTNTELQIQCSHSLIDPVPVVIINEETQFIRKFCCVQVTHMSVSLQEVIYYLPVSLLCIISKVLERLIYDKIIDLVATSLTPLQFGFQRGSSTLQQLLVYFHQLITSKEEIDAIYINFHKAFNSVPHNELLIKWV